MRKLFIIALALTVAPAAWANDGPKPVATVASHPVAMPATASALPKIAPTAESKALALELMTLLNSEELTRRQLAKAYTETMPKVLAGNQQFRVLEFQYPGISVAAIKAEREIVESGTIAMLPGIQNALAEAVSAHLTAPELRDLLVYYRSPLGAKILDGIAEGSDLSALAQKNLNEDETPLTASDLKNATSEAALPSIMKSLNKDDIHQLVRFGVSPLGRKWRVLGQLMLSTAAEYQNNNTSDMKTKAQENVMMAVVQYMQDHPSAAPSK